LKIIIVRHTQTGQNANRQYSGQQDIPLTHVGVKQAQSLRGLLAGEKIVEAFSSDLICAVQTARIVLAGRGINIVETKLLREVDVGIAAGFTREEVLERYCDPYCVSRYRSSNISRASRDRPSRTR